LISTQGKKKSHKNKEKSNVDNQICYKKWVKNQTSGNGLSRRIDVVGCGNAVRKEGREEGKRKRIDVGCNNARGKEEEEGVVGWSFTHIIGVA
jgi:hypothetical protein